jgi:hypothetical protein
MFHNHKKLLLTSTDRLQQLLLFRLKLDSWLATLKTSDVSLAESTLPCCCVKSTLILVELGCQANQKSSVVAANQLLGIFFSGTTQFCVVNKTQKVRFSGTYCLHFDKGFLVGSQ